MSAFCRADRTSRILVCATCSKRLGGGFGKGGKQSLATALRKAMGIRRFRRTPLSIIEVKCLGVCPRGAMTLADMRADGKLHLVARGADLNALAREIGVPGELAATEPGA